MEYVFIVSILALLLVVLVAVRVSARHLIQKAPPAEPEEQRYLDQMEMLILQHRRVTYIYIIVALLSIGGILFFWLWNIRSLETMRSSSLSTLFACSLWGGYFLPFFTKMRHLAPNDRTRLRRFVLFGIVLGTLLLIAALILTFLMGEW